MLGMQRLSAPTRREVDEAHQKYKWVDIGGPSLRNLGFINRWRTLGWFIFAASSLPLHLLYNSAMFAQTNATFYNVLVVNPDFISGAPFNTSRIGPEGSLCHPELQWLQDNISGLVNLSVTECIEAYSKQVQTERGDVLAVTVADLPTFNNTLYDVHCYNDGSRDKFSG